MRRYNRLETAVLNDAIEEAQKPAVGLGMRHLQTGAPAAPIPAARNDATLFLGRAYIAAVYRNQDAVLKFSRSSITEQRVFDKTLHSLEMRQSRRNALPLKVAAA